jgi:cardiolipin synthase
MFPQTIQPKEIWSIPNILSLIRVALIPFVLFYYLKGEVKLAGIALIISAVTDVGDGFIARRFNQTTALGKILDPVADKLTQCCVATLLCLTYPALIPLALVLAVKELLMGFMGITLLRRGKQPFSARWWGKLATITFYVATIAIMLFGDRFSKGSIWAISLTVLLLLAHSLFRYYNMLKSQLREP